MSEPDTRLTEDQLAEIEARANAASEDAAMFVGEGPDKFAVLHKTGRGAVLMNMLSNAGADIRDLTRDLRAERAENARLRGLFSEADAELLVKSVEQGDRYAAGGFCLMFTASERAATLDLARRIRAAIGETPEPPVKRASSEPSANV